MIERVPLSQLALKLPSYVDLFVCSASFEQRCQCISMEIDPVRVGAVILCEPRDAIILAENCDANSLLDGNSRELSQHFGARVERVALDKADPLLTADRLRYALLRHIGRRAARILVDITTFTHEGLLILLGLLWPHLRSGSSISLVYMAAAEYSVGLPPEEKWLSKGIGEIRTVLGYLGEVLPSRKSHLIVLVGFEAERARKLIDAYEPNVLSLGLGRYVHGEGDGGHHRVNRYFHSAVAERYRKYFEFEFPPFDPLGTKAAVEEQMRRAPDTNVIVAAMNTKLSTVGAGLAARDHGAAQLCYASAMQYNVRDYSSPGTDTYIFRLGPDILGS